METMTESESSEEMQARRSAVSSGFAHCGRAALLAIAFARTLARPTDWFLAAFAEGWRQTRSTFPLVIVLCSLGGALMSQQMGIQFQGSLPNWFVGAIVAASITTELAPLFVGFALVGVVGARIAAEVATMQITEQVDALEVIGRDPVPILVTPRVIAGLVAGPVLVSFGLVAALLAGWILAVLVTPASTAEFWFGVRNITRDFHLYYALIKAAVFGFVITFTGCYVGLEARGGSVGVGRATTTAVVSMISAVVLLNTLLVPLLKLTKS
jgi:phospholipid/cholesterol/gamma-HCH transport system permease protein